MKFNRYYFHRIKDYTIKAIKENEKYKDEIIDLYYSLLIAVAKNNLDRDKINNFYRDVERIKSSQT